MINTALAGAEKRKMCNLVSRIGQNITPKNNHNPTLIEMFQAFTEEVIPDIDLDMDPRKVDDPLWLVKLRTRSPSPFVINPEKMLKVGSQLVGHQRDAFVNFLKINWDLFAWKHTDMTDISPYVICNRLNIDPSKRPIRQKRRSWEMAHMCRLHRPQQRVAERQLSPPQLVDATTGHGHLSFMDAYTGYNQIPMYPPDKKHNSFIIDRRIYCYKVMPFGFRNADATYQCLVNNMFSEQIGWMMEVYINDMPVKSKMAKNHIAYLEKSFAIMRAYGMRFNPTKSV